jgi:hypothetical protein
MFLVAVVAVGAATIAAWGARSRLRAPLGQERKESIQMLQEPLTEGSSYRFLVGLFCSYCPAWGMAPIWRIRLNSSSMVHDSAILPPSMR